MAVFARVFLVFLSGVLFSSGWINDELRALLQTDPDVAEAVQVALSGVAAGLWWAWWRLARRFGWTT